MPNKVEYEIPTWNQIYDILLNLNQKIQATPFHPDVVVAIARGGLVAGRVLVDLLETPQLTTLQIEFYTGITQTKTAPNIKQKLTNSVTNKKVLLVDDIADSGKTLKLAHTILQKQKAAQIQTATLYWKPQSNIKPDFTEKQTQNWVIFPWDTKETLQKILQTHQDKQQSNKEIAKIVKAGLPQQIADKLLNP